MVAWGKPSHLSVLEDSRAEGSMTDWGAPASSRPQDTLLPMQLFKCPKRFGLGVTWLAWDEYTGPPGWGLVAMQPVFPASV